MRNFGKFLRTPFLQNTSGRLLPDVIRSMITKRFGKLWSQDSQTNARWQTHRRVVRRCSVKKVFLEISQKPPTLLKKRLWHGCFRVNLWNSQECLFHRKILVAASVNARQQIQLVCKKGDAIIKNEKLIADAFNNYFTGIPKALASI